MKANRVMGHTGDARWPMGRAARYLIIAAIGHLAWETAHLSRYTIWWTGTAHENFVAVVHCTGGDVLITTAALLIGALIASLRGWRPFGLQMVIVAIVLGVAYTILSEWLNVTVWRSWAYTSAMPLLPWLATGLSPLLQWLVVPGLAFAIIGRSRVGRP